MKTMVVADIHGYYDLMKQAVDYWKSLEDTRLVFLGDYIDRGPEPLKCLDCVYKLQTENTKEVFALIGNHEDLLIHYLDEGLFIAGNGTEITLEKLVDESDLNLIRSGEFGKVALYKKVKDKHIDLYNWLIRRPTIYTDENLLAVHAGVDFSNISETTRDFALWARQEYMVLTNTYGKPVVSGHTPIMGVTHVMDKYSLTYQEKDNIVVTADDKYFIDGGVYLDGKLNTVLFDDGKLIEVNTFS